MMCGSGRWLRTRGVKQSQSASRVASAAPASRVESKRQPSLKRIQNHPRAHSIRTSRSVPNLGIVARPIRAIRSARASSSVLLRLAGERIPPSRARRRPASAGRRARARRSRRHRVRARPSFVRSFERLIDRSVRRIDRWIERAFARARVRSAVSSPRDRARSARARSSSRANVSSSPRVRAGGNDRARRGRGLCF